MKWFTNLMLAALVVAVSPTVLAPDQAETHPDAVRHARRELRADDVVFTVYPHRGERLLFIPPAKLRRP